jgi:hypothetical protein
MLMPIRYVFVLRLVRTASIGFKGPAGAIAGGGKLISIVMW